MRAKREGAEAESEKMKGIAVLIPVFVSIILIGSLGFTTLTVFLPLATTTTTTTVTSSVSNTPGSSTHIVYDQPNIAPGPIIAYVPLTISNSKSPTMAPPQEMISVNSLAYSNYEASNLDNVEFFYTNGTVIPSWIETNASNSSTNSSYWINIGNNIPAKTQLTIFMGFATLGTSLFGNVVGESPTLSPLYAQYDTGAKIFSFYDNFAGKTLSPQWVSSGNVVVNNGLYIYSSKGVNSYIKSVYSNFSPVNNALEVYVPKVVVSSTSNYLIFGYNALNSPSSHALLFKSTNAFYKFISCTDACTTIETNIAPFSGPAIFGMFTGSSGASHGYLTAPGTESNPNEYSGQLSSNFKANAYLVLQNTYPTGSNMTVSYVRIRAMLPQSATMPTITFNATDYIILTLLNPFFSGGNVITYDVHGTVDNITLTGPAGHNLQVLVNGKMVASSLNGIVLYNLPAAAGTYNVIGKDVNSGNSVSQVYRILQANSLSLVSLWANNTIYTGASEIGSASVQSPSNQLTAMLLKNGTTIGTTNSFMSFNIGPQTGKFNFTLRVNGNNNYTGTTLTSIATVAKAQPYLAFDMRSYDYNGSYETSYANVVSFGNQLSGTLYENGSLVAGASSSTRFTMGPGISINQFTFSTPGNSNYTSANVSYTLHVYPDTNSLVPGVIKHVIIITQENHAFDNYFGTYPGAVGIPANACEPINVSNLSKGCVAPFLTINEPTIDMAHSWNSSHWAWDNGKMDRFVSITRGVTEFVNVNGNPFVMATYNYQMLPYYWGEAGNYTLADNFFSAALSYSLPDHWFEVAANAPAITMSSSWSDSQLDDPISESIYLNESNPIPTLADELQKAGISWMYYGRTQAPTYNAAVSSGKAFDYWEPLSAQNRSYSAAYLPHFAYFSSIFNSISNGTLPAVSWVVPNLNLSEHAPANIIQGMWYTTDIVDSVENSSYWNSTLIIITWDEYGGYYDSVPPPIVNGTPLGFRVPALFISPYSKTDYIDDTNSSFMSTMKFIEWNWNLSALNGLDAGASNLLNTFYYNQSQGPSKPRAMPLSNAQLSLVNYEMTLHTGCLLCSPIISGVYDSPLNSNSTVDVNGYILPSSWFVT